MDPTQLMQEANEFLSFVNRIDGLYVDAIFGFERNADFAEERQYKYMHKAAERQQHVSLEMLDRAVWQYNRTAEGQGARLQHQTTFGDFKARNGLTGPNARFFASLCVASVFHYWEDFFRQRIADALGVKKEAIKIPILGDLRLYRQAIVHNNGIATRDMKRCTEIDWFEQGQLIELYEHQIDEVIQKVVQGVEQFVNHHLEEHS